jgi:hypothetical protein
MRHKKNFKCKCGQSFLTNQRLKEHECKLLEKLQKRRLDRNWNRLTNMLNKKHENVQLKSFCEECKTPIDGISEGWWCNKCGIGFCLDCREGRSLNHLYGCYPQR